MKRFLLLYCIYDPYSYIGHRRIFIIAPDMADARTQAEALIAKASVRTQYELDLFEITDRKGPWLLDAAPVTSQQESLR